MNICYILYKSKLKNFRNVYVLKCDRPFAATAHMYKKD